MVEFDEQRRAISIDEKPETSRSGYAVTGLYFYDGQVVDIAANLQPSPRGELEITDVNRIYLHRGQLNVEVMGCGYAWLDTGRPESLLDAAVYVRVLEKLQGFKIASPEEVAFRQDFIDASGLERCCAKLGKSDYARYVRQVTAEG